MRNKKLLLFLIVLFIAAFNSKMSAQVTVGSDHDAETFALLQIKETQPVGGEVTATTGGFLFPRVKLTDLTSLSDLTVDNPTLPKTKREHIGLMVFNVNTNSKLIPGLYVWDGDQWVMLILE